MSIHKNLTQPEAIHPFAFASNADPAADSTAGVAARKGWLDTSTSPATLKVRNAGNTDWDGIQVQTAGASVSYASNSNDVSYAGAAGASTLVSRADHVHRGVTSVSHASNTFTGPITLTTPGNTVGITSPTTGTYAFTAAAQAAGSAFNENLLPWTIHLQPTFVKANTNWATNTGADGLQWLNYGRESTGAQNAEITWDVVLAAGTWSVFMIFIKGTDRGIFSVQFDSVEKGTIDSYNGSLARNQTGSVTGITVGTSGKIEFKLKMATKNASSAGYYGTVNLVTLIRTA